MLYPVFDGILYQHVIVSGLLFAGRYFYAHEDWSGYGQSEYCAFNRVVPFSGTSGVVLATAISNILTCIIALLLFHKRSIRFLWIFCETADKDSFAVAVSTVMSNLWLRAGLMQIAIINFIMAAIIEFGCYILISIICREEVVMDCIGLVKNRLGGKHE